MKKKLVGIGVMMLFIATAVLPAVGTINEYREITPTNYNQPTVEWTKTFDRGQFDYFHTVRQTSDGGYIASGATEENKMYYVWVVKVDANGNEEWRVVNHDLNGTIMGTTISVSGYDVQQTSDGGYIVIGASYLPFDTESGIYWDTTTFLWKLDATGNTQWLKHYYEQTDEYLVIYYNIAVIEVENGFVASCYDYYYYPSTESWSDHWYGFIMKTDSSGVKQWVREFENVGNGSLGSISRTSDGGFFLSGFTDGITAGALWMVKTDADGNKQWESLFDGPEFEYTYGKGNCQTNDGGYIMNGVTQSYGHGGFDVWLIKTDSSGNKLWDNTFGGKKTDYCWSMCKADNDGFALGILTNYGSFAGTKEDFLIVETDKDGNAEWQFQIEQADPQMTRFIDPTKDGGYIVGGCTNAIIGGTKGDAFLVKIASFDNQRPLKPEIDGPAKGKVGINSTFTASSTDPDGGPVSYRWDWGDGNYSDWLSTAETTHLWAYEANFEVRVMAQDEHGGESVWSDPLPIAIPYSYNIPMNQFWMKLLERFPNAFPLLRQLIGY
jgi:hypothetical protein